jgi:hypothetical protein
MNVDALSSIVPATVRTDSEQERAALGFEGMLLGELVQAMVPEGTLTEGPYAPAIQDALTGGLLAGGGIGLAAQLFPKDPA